MIIRNSFYAAFSILIMGFIKSALSGDNGYGYENRNCETIFTTITAPASSTFTYTSTSIVPAGSAGVVTKFVDKPETLKIVTSIAEGKTHTITVYSTKIKFDGATTTKVSTSTYTTFPNAVTTIYSTETVVAFVKGTLTVTYPSPVLNIPSISRYTGAPTSLWLSVI